ncbi:MAG: class I SAM-dependent methyltransferase [Spirochaetes bacterium]|jgi:SAM-dependent methyltransferase|nr:class I SAM-dependent methyltransferase [Spirochaetota bacterium]
MSERFSDLKDRCRAKLLPYTRRAFSSVPPVSNPLIVDAGCGTGVPTIELARLSGGTIYAVDTDARSLEILRAKADLFGLRKRIRIVDGSIDSPDLPSAGIDILWSEGLFNVIGFEKGMAWASGRVRPGGFLVIHDECAGENEKALLIREHGFTVLDSFILDETIWWDDYYGCLEKAVASLSETVVDEDVRQAVAEIQEYKKNPGEFRSIFYILEKTA